MRPRWSRFHVAVAGWSTHKLNQPPRPADPATYYTQKNQLLVIPVCVYKEMHLRVHQTNRFSQCDGEAPSRRKRWVKQMHFFVNRQENPTTNVFLLFFPSVCNRSQDLRALAVDKACVYFNQQQRRGNGSNAASKVRFTRPQRSFSAKLRYDS